MSRKLWRKSCKLPHHTTLKIHITPMNFQLKFREIDFFPKLVSWKILFWSEFLVFSHSQKNNLSVTLFGNYWILLPQFFRKFSVKLLTFYYRIDLTKIILRGSFSTIWVRTLKSRNFALWKNPVKSTDYCKLISRIIFQMRVNFLFFHVQK